MCYELIRMIWSKPSIRCLKWSKLRTWWMTRLWTVSSWIALCSILLPWWHHIQWASGRGVALLKIAMDTSISNKRRWSQQPCMMTVLSIGIIEQWSSKLCIIRKSIAIIWRTLSTRRIWIWILYRVIDSNWSAIQRNTIHEVNCIRCRDLFCKAYKTIGFLFAGFFVFWNVNCF